MRKTLLAAALALVACGCAVKRVSAEPPTAHLAESREAIRAAEELGAARVPEAATYLGFARQQVGVAERLMQEGHHDAAGLQLRQAVADAQLAFALARVVPLENEARQLTQQAETLRRSPR